MTQNAIIQSHITYWIPENNLENFLRVTLIIYFAEKVWDTMQDLERDIIHSSHMDGYYL